MEVHEIKQALAAEAKPETARRLQKFFKTAPGEYGHGDIFVGVRVPDIRKIVKPYRYMPLDQIQTLLLSDIHEERFAALVILVNQYRRKDTTEERRKEIVELYVTCRQRINSWDLVDVSAPNILGAWLFKRDKRLLYSLARSRNLWDRRISVISTFYFIKHNSFDDTLAIAEILLDDKDDLIHKAVGWMLREVGKRSVALEEQFLKQHHKQMPRTMLRYAIEKFPPQTRAYYLGK